LPHCFSLLKEKNCVGKVHWIVADQVALMKQPGFKKYFNPIKMKKITFTIALILSITLVFAQENENKV